MKTILAPVDFSPATDAVIAEATALARGRDGRVVLLNITQPVAVVADYAAFLENIAEINDITAKAAKKELGKLERRLEGALVKVSSIQLSGSPVPLIIEQAEKLSADYIVVGSHGHTAFYDLLVGSTASGVLKRAPCPVVIIPPSRKKARKTRR